MAEIHLGRLPEAEAALTAALEKYPEDAELIANSIVLNVLAGRPTEELESYVSHCSLGFCCDVLNLANGYISGHRRLQNAQSSHALLADIQEKSAFFDTAAAKYAPRVSS